MSDGLDLDELERVSRRAQHIGCWHCTPDAPNAIDTVLALIARVREAEARALREQVLAQFTEETADMNGKLADLLRGDRDDWRARAWRAEAALRAAGYRLDAEYDANDFDAAAKPGGAA